MPNHLLYDIRWQFPKSLKNDIILKPTLKVFCFQKVKTDQIKFR